MRVLFVCLGNICRSPAAEGIFRHKLKEHGLEGKVTHDSSGTGGWHIGHPPDGRMTAHAKERGYDLSDLKARKFHAVNDFKNFDLILTMDDSNYYDVLNFTMEKSLHAKVKKMTSYCKIHDIGEVPDPYYRDEEGFEHVLDILEDACDQLIAEIKTGLAAKE